MLSQARGSLYEVEAQVIAATRLVLLSQEQANTLRRLAKKAGGRLAGLIRWVRKREFQNKRTRSRKGTGNRQPVTRNRQPVTNV
jgi:hypothetical protein